jgi:hypothetical protein
MFLKQKELVLSKSVKKIKKVLLDDEKMLKEIAKEEIGTIFMFLEIEGQEHVSAGEAVRAVKELVSIISGLAVLSDVFETFETFEDEK